MFASKVNFITILTGTSHEKLQVFHRWSAWIMCKPLCMMIARTELVSCRDLNAGVLALMHTIILVREAIKQGTMVSQWKTGPWYWTGVAALIPQVSQLFLNVTSMNVDPRCEDLACSDVFWTDQVRSRMTVFTVEVLNNSTGMPTTRHSKSASSSIGPIAFC